MKYSNYRASNFYNATISSSGLNSIRGPFLFLLFFSNEISWLKRLVETTKATSSFNEHPGRNLLREVKDDEDQVVGIPPLSILGSPIQIEVHGNERRDVPPLWGPPSWDRCTAHSPRIFSSARRWKKKEEEEICIFPPRKNYYLISRDSENK